MGLVNDDGVEIIGRELSQPFFPHQSLDGTDHNPEPAAQTGLLRFLRGTSQFCSLGNLIRRLVQEFATVGQD